MTAWRFARLLLFLAAAGAALATHDEGWTVAAFCFGVSGCLDAASE